VRQRRAGFPAELQALRPARVIAVDEAGATISLTRTHGRAPPGQRVVDDVPQGSWHVSTMLGAISVAGPLAGLVFEGATDAEALATFAEEVLAPVLRPGDVVLLDNLSSHKGERVRRAIEATGARLLFLPPYSPDFNPIEKMWAKVKAQLRSAARRTVPALWEAICAAFQAVTAADCQGFFASCNLPLPAT
jgi:transposase